VRPRRGRYSVQTPDMMSGGGQPCTRINSTTVKPSLVIAHSLGLCFFGGRLRSWPARLPLLRVNVAARTRSTQMGSFVISDRLLHLLKDGWARRVRLSNQSPTRAEPNSRAGRNPKGRFLAWPSPQGRAGEGGLKARCAGSQVHHQSQSSTARKSGRLGRPTTAGRSDDPKLQRSSREPA